MPVVRLLQDFIIRNAGSEFGDIDEVVAVRAKALDDQRSQMGGGDLVVVPSTAANIQPMGGLAWAKVIDVIHVPLPWLATMNMGVGAGFYADVFGPLPFAFGRVAPERFTVY